MTVKQLIEELSQLDPELRVFTKGYEGGFADANIHSGRIYDFNLNHYKEWYYGPHEIVEQEDANTVKGIAIWQKQD